MADTKRAISVDSLQATTDLLNQLTADAQAIIDTLNQTGGVAPVWINTNVPPNTVGGYDNINPATDVNGLEFAAAMNKLLFPSISPTITLTTSGSIPYLAPNPQFTVNVNTTVLTSGATLASFVFEWKRSNQSIDSYQPITVAITTALVLNFNYSIHSGGTNTTNDGFDFRVTATDSLGGTRVSQFTGAQGKQMTGYALPTVSIGNVTETIERGSLNKTFTNFSISSTNTYAPILGDDVTALSVEVLSSGSVATTIPLSVNDTLHTVVINNTLAEVLKTASNATVRVRIKDTVNPAGTTRTIYTVTTRLKQYYGPAVSSLSNAFIKNEFSNVSTQQTFDDINTLTMITGTLYKDFYVFVPVAKTLVSARNITNGTDIFFDYIGNESIMDGGVTLAEYKRYVYPIAVPYAPSNTIQIELS
jgi:hypothetical protein